MFTYCYRPAVLSKAAGGKRQTCRRDILISVYKILLSILPITVKVNIIYKYIETHTQIHNTKHNCRLWDRLSAPACAPVCLYVSISRLGFLVRLHSSSVIANAQEGRIYGAQNPYDQKAGSGVIRKLNNLFSGIPLGNFFVNLMLGGILPS